MLEARRLGYRGGAARRSGAEGLHAPGGFVPRGERLWTRPGIQHDGDGARADAVQEWR